MQRFLKTDVPREKASAPARFLVRKGTKGWMVYDRQLKGPAIYGTTEAANLTKERAEHIERMLMAEWEPKHSV
jgi:hypothetical protein